MPTPLDLLEADRWTVCDGHIDQMPYTLRFREPVLQAHEPEDFSHLLRCVWPYALEGEGELPDEALLAELEQFENRLCDALEGSGKAVLAAVLTLDGARQWVFYTSDVAACGDLLNHMPQEESPYPIELDAQSDPEWSYLREQIVGDRGAA